MVYLSKSDFKLAKTCAKKLVYKKAGYPTANDTNEYMQVLAEGGYVVGKMACVLYPEGIEISGSTEECIEQTNYYLQQDNVVLFEPAFLSYQKLVRVDILIKKGNEFQLIEVKSGSQDSIAIDNKKYLRDEIYDVAYQYLVLKECYPDCSIKCYLMMPDKSKKTAIDGLASWFNIEPNIHLNESVENEELPAQKNPKFNKPKVSFKHESASDVNGYIDLLKVDGILSSTEITKEVEAMQTEIRINADKFIRILNDGIHEEDYSLSKDCKGCEFNSKGSEVNGYSECWNELAYTDHHIFDLYFSGALKADNDNFYVNELIKEGKIKLEDIALENLKNKKGELGSRGIRQSIQIKHTLDNTEWQSPELINKFEEFQYPLHFIDFETYTGAIPFNSGMRTYELIAFQWSCHTIIKKGATPIHYEWIHTRNDFPNFEFAITLMERIGKIGTPFMWATHENTVLKTILKQMDERNYEHKILYNWIVEMTHDKERKGRWVDMNALTLQYYFHPDMKGKTSIKKVLPAIWSSNINLHDVPFFKDYVPDELVKGLIDPYDTLINGIDLVDDDEVVKGGTAAMRAYYRIRFDNTIDDNKRDSLKKQLLAYCKLDTMAMVIIAHHWGLR